VREVGTVMLVMAMVVRMHGWNVGLQGPRSKLQSA
jgi:hypothetical protein